MRKAQGGVNAAVLVAIITGLIILYILFLPESERRAILENESVTKTSKSSSKEDIDVLLKKSPGRLDIVEEIQEKRIPDIFLFQTTDAKELERINPLIVRNGWFDKKSRTVSFGINDLENTDNIILSFKAKTHKGILTIKLNNEIIFENEIETETVAPIKLKKSLLNEENTFDFSVNSVGYKFWSTNEYSLEDIKIIGDITDRSKQESNNVFTLTGTELNNIDRANLRFVPYCSSQAQVGVLDVLLNNRELFSAVPICRDPYKQEIPLGILESGVNTIIFKTSKGSYSVEQIQVEFEEKDIKTSVYYFEVNESQIEDIEDGDKDALLTIEFVDDEKNKRADININNRLFTIDQEKRIFTKKLNSGNNPDFIKEGNNFIEIRPRTMLDIVELKIELQKR